MFRAAVRSAGVVARTAARPKPSVALRALSTTPARLSEGPKPELFGPGAKAGEVPTDENQATGLERAQVLAEREGVELFDENPLDSSRIGTLADPIKVLSYEHSRLVGCTGSPAESHELLWMNLTQQKKRRCPECGSVYELDYQGDSEVVLHELH
ncbi:cytochrome c oxidase polypeptide IV [Fomitopsis serialis]|uniref:cytochrome c oxidase polypeptide IV n=1 Tax=Fomitopsis serialis TaxID=139415 RepID=UPI002008D0D7|nr:cytochrome c oxidase polypeptide IV [Neoantrodia serialis]KAH9917030.1 cytochrome c oxidase polypeptide IV [Neoantrodia serialis]